MSRYKNKYIDDPDETRGRALYRAHADALATAQVSYDSRRVRLSSNETNNTDNAQREAGK